MHDQESVRAVLEALELGFTCDEAEELTGVPARTVRMWRSGKVPHERKVKPVKRRRWPEDIRRAARDLVEAGHTRREVAAALGISERSACYLTHGAKRAPREVPKMGKPTRVDPRASAEVRALQARVRELELEKAAAEELLAVLKAGLPCGGEPTRRERARTAEGLVSRGFTATEACRAMGIARSTFYYDRSHPLPADRDAAVRPLVTALFEQGGRNWGYRTIWAHLRRSGTRVSEKVVRRVMREEGLAVAYDRRRRRAYSSYAGEVSAAPPNLVARDFHAAAPDELWLTDITEFRLPGGAKVYLSPVVDCFDGKPVAWSIGPRPTKELANSSLLKALARRRAGARTVIHSDRGGHYRWNEWVSICEENGLARSMSRKACCADNSACEGLFGRLKNEFFYYRDWGGVTPDEFMDRLDAYLIYYCEGRIKRSLGWMSPNEYRRSKGYAL